MATLIRSATPPLFSCAVVSLSLTFTSLWPCESAAFPYAGPGSSYGDLNRSPSAPPPNAFVYRPRAAAQKSQPKVAVLTPKPHHSGAPRTQTNIPPTPVHPAYANAAAKKRRPQITSGIMRAAQATPPTAATLTPIWKPPADIYPQNCTCAEKTVRKKQALHARPTGRPLQVTPPVPPALSQPYTIQPDYNAVATPRFYPGAQAQLKKAYVPPYTPPTRNTPEKARRTYVSSAKVPWVTAPRPLHRRRPSGNDIAERRHAHSLYGAPDYGNVSFVFPSGPGDSFHRFVPPRPENVNRVNAMWIEAPKPANTRRPSENAAAQRYYMHSQEPVYSQERGIPYHVQAKNHGASVHGAWGAGTPGFGTQTKYRY